MSNMFDILKKIDAIENKTKLNECGDMPSPMPSTPVSVNLTAPTANDMAQMLRALANIESGKPMAAMVAMSKPMSMPMAAGAMEDEYETDEAFVNEPDEQYADHKFMTKDLSGGINREKKMYKPAAKGDNPMAVESIKDRLYAALNEKKAKPDFLDMDKDGNKKEPMKKAVADKKKKSPFKEAAKPDFLDMDKDGNKKEPMKKAVADKKKKSPVKEVAAPNYELDDTSRKAMNIAQKIKRKINSGEQMDDRDYNQMAELGAILSRFGTNFGPKSMKDVMSHMVQYTNDRNEEGHGYPNFDVNRFKELISMTK